ncbi:hypothetical protein LMH87_004183 [Akanthomyces muscarius]|uniref:TM7S3/TM198-like domain-containing protein n=1 Tax=Akanthomyces muscarius TaxID=2231603 RepID=A0A9W8Q2T6_AKAMU|nr:hypothetical protein LMH87_004183 [Akanthomyces muscarius]KAJ4145328.1 hypothetical protein LMH87_004183 [Akanthomyces muscarius]
MFLKPFRICALLCLILALQLATAQSFQVIRRADDATPTAGGAPPATTKPPVETGKGDDGNNDSSSKSASGDLSASLTGTATDSHNSTASGTSTASTPTPSLSGNSTFLNVTIPHGQLPLAPVLTPGWGVAGIIMMLTGLVYALIGIKNPWIHAFFSTAYMAALGVTVLIVYVMNVPLSNALQGGYVAAIILSGCAIGAASIFFKELTEGLGCALGGFCFSMWLLCLVPGGLLHSTASKAIFIACFTLVGFAFYFSRFTRDWSLIVSIAFAGATIAVLGIDCFSRAGLKEFWAWIWALNDNLFPLGADTYPVTRGIRVETAAIVIIFLVATMSQVRLWKIVREKREKRAALRAEGQRNLEEEEETVGRQIEEANARDRAEWERVYGDGGAESITASHLTENGEVHEKDLSRSRVYAARKGSGEATEMSELSECGQSGMDQLMAGEGEDGGVTVRVGADEIHEGEGDEMVAGDQDMVVNEKVDEGVDVPQQPTAVGQRSSKISTQNRRASGNPATSGRALAHSQMVTPSPDVVPLPFNVPKGHRARSERSSVATFADDADEDLTSVAPRRDQRHSVVKRLSRGSADLLRSLSQRSGRSSHTPELAHNGGESTEMLLTQMKPHRQNQDNESLAATVDLESVSGGERRSIDLDDGDNDPEAEVKAVDEAEEKDELKDAEAPPAHTTAVDQASVTSKKATRQSTASQNKRSSFRSQVVAGPAESEAPDESVYAPQSEMPKSIASEMSGPVSLTRERLPSSLSRVALSYRTNEWAKHLSNADLPDMDQLPVEKPVRTKKAAKERAKPVNIEELQRTAEDGAPAPALPRSQSRMSTMSIASAKPQTPVPAEAEPTQMIIPVATTSPRDTSSPVSPTDTTAAPRLRSASSTNMRKISPTVQPIPEEERSVTDASGVLPVAHEEDEHPAMEASPVLEASQFVKPAAVPGIVSYASPQTLLGQREMFLRTRSQGSLVNTIGEMQATPAPPTAAASDAGSIHNYPMYAAAFASDPDEIPLSQRRSMILGSRMSMNESSYSLNRSESRAGSSHGGVDNLTFNSHQPQRNSGLPTQAVRDTQLANFRMSVSQDLRAGNPMMSSGGRETPFASTNSLLGGREAEVQRNIEMQRHVLMGQKEAEAQRREMQRRDKEFSDRAFDDRMRSGDLLDAHREAMRKMQRGSGKR